MSRLIDADALKETVEKYRIVHLSHRRLSAIKREAEEVINDICLGIDFAPTIYSAKRGKWILDEDPHDGDCRCSACRVAINQMHERNHGLLNELTGGKWWTFYKFCPNCGADMRGEEDDSD